MIYLMSVGCGIQFAGKNGSCPGLNGWRGWGRGAWRWQAVQGRAGRRRQAVRRVAGWRLDA